MKKLEAFLYNDDLKSDGFSNFKSVSNRPEKYLFADPIFENLIVSCRVTQGGQVLNG